VIALATGFLPAIAHAQIALLTAKAAIARGEFELAYQQLTNAIEAGQLTGTSLAEAYFYRGGILQSDGHFRAAISEYDRAVALAPTLAPAYMDRGITYYWLGQYARAVTDYNKTISLRPDFDLAYINRGNALQELEAHELATLDYDLALQINPNALAAYTGRAMASYRQHDFDAAITDYTRAMALDRGHNGAAWGRGYSMFNLSKYRAAALDFATLVRNDPQSTYAAIWHYFASVAKRTTASTRHAASRLAEETAYAPADQWPYPVVSYLLGHTDRHVLLAKSFSADPAARRAKLAETYFSLGIASAFRGEDDLAADNLRRASELGGTDYADMVVISVWLERLGPAGIVVIPN
jgi:lipoprotein NlpI